jgi:hypothetical protein
LVWADAIKLDAIVIGCSDQVERIIELLAVEALVLQALEGALTDTVLPGGLTRVRT